MKIFRFPVISFFIVLGFLVLAGSASLEAAEYCWQDEMGGVVSLEITHVGHGHYIVNGRLTPTVGPIEVVSGNAEVAAGQLIVHLTTASSDPTEVWTWIGTAVLDLPGLNGYVEGLGNWYDKGTGQSGISYDGQETLTRITCP